MADDDIVNLDVEADEDVLDYEPPQIESKTKGSAWWIILIILIILLCCCVGLVIGAAMLLVGSGEYTIDWTSVPFFWLRLI